MWKKLLQVLELSMCHRPQASHLIPALDLYMYYIHTHVCDLYIYYIHTHVHIHQLYKGWFTCFKTLESYRLTVQYAFLLNSMILRFMWDNSLEISLCWYTQVQFIHLNSLLECMTSYSFLVVNISSVSNFPSLQTMGPYTFLYVPLHRKSFFIPTRW